MKQASKILPQLELDFNYYSDQTTICFQCVFDDECTIEERETLNKENKGCKKFKLNDLPF